MKSLAFILLFSTSAFAFTPSEGLREFCEDRKDKHFIKELARHPENLFAFRNQGGIVNGGVCWWHSRFQRNALYLTHYNPTAPKPEPGQIPALIRSLRNANRVIEIPGFHNFKEFSATYQKEIQKELETWQKFESLRGTWIRGLRGSPVVSAEFMKELMDDLYEEVEIKNSIAYQKMQVKGVASHAWLVLSMKKFENGYELEIIESNFPDKTQIYSYRHGDTNLTYFAYGPFTPYLEFTQETARTLEVIQAACAQ